MLAYARAQWDKLSAKRKRTTVYSVVGFFGSLVILSIIFHARILEWAKPIAQKYTQKPGGFLLPSLLLVVVSFPPLFGHEFISLLTGFIYGNIGFLIVLISTTLGESLLFLSFRHFFKHRLGAFRAKYEDYNIFVRVIEEGGPLMLFAIRTSAIPSHFSTPLFASIDAIEYKVWLLCCLGSSFSLYPPVYFGWLLQRGQSSNATPWLLTIAALITVSVGLYIYIQYRRHKKASQVNTMTRDLEATDLLAADFQHEEFDIDTDAESEADDTFGNFNSKPNRVSADRAPMLLSSHE